MNTHCYGKLIFLNKFQFSDQNKETCTKCEGKSVLVLNLPEHANIRYQKDFMCVYCY